MIASLSHTDKCSSLLLSLCVMLVSLAFFIWWGRSSTSNIRKGWTCLASMQYLIRKGGLYRLKGLHRNVCWKRRRNTTHNLPLPLDLLDTPEVRTERRLQLELISMVTWSYSQYSWAWWDSGGTDDGQKPAASKFFLRLWVDLRLIIKSLVWTSTSPSSMPVCWAEGHGQDRVQEDWNFFSR